MLEGEETSLAMQVRWGGKFRGVKRPGVRETYRLNEKARLIRGGAGKREKETTAISGLPPIGVKGKCIVPSRLSDR